MGKMHERQDDLHLCPELRRERTMVEGDADVLFRAPTPIINKGNALVAGADDDMRTKLIA
jgi:hypothetical protein